jgi:hypothetical protein
MRRARRVAVSGGFQAFQQGRDEVRSISPIRLRLPVATPEPHFRAARRVTIRRACLFFSFAPFFIAEESPPTLFLQFMLITPPLHSPPFLDVGDGRHGLRTAVDFIQLVFDGDEFDICSVVVHRRCSCIFCSIHRSTSASRHAIRRGDKWIGFGNLPSCHSRRR